MSDAFSSSIEISRKYKPIKETQKLSFKFYFFKDFTFKFRGWKFPVFFDSLLAHVCTVMKEV